MKRPLSVLTRLSLGLASVASLHAQSFTRQDSLRGTLSPLRSCYDVTHYDLRVQVDPATRRIEGSNVITYRPTADFRRMQVDLFANLDVTDIRQNGRPLKFSREGNALFLTLPEVQRKNRPASLRISYRGRPIVAKNPPWDGGFSWKKDRSKNDWVTVSCEGTGASLWWPCKDHLSDEPDSMRIRIAAPAGLMAVANGNLRGVQKLKNGFSEYDWAVSYPINTYNVTLNAGDYVPLHDTYRAADGDTLALDYYVFRYNRAIAGPHFAQVKPMLACYEQFFGKYPFWRDGYALVETPYWGMEHQGAIAYGNFFKNNPFGFDFIIVHESGHEYFGNSLSAADHAEMWIHEAFTTYMETLYLECTKNYEESLRYLFTQRMKIKNDYPMLGPLGVNFQQKDTDVYYKGAWMLHTLRHVLANDALWFRTLKGLAVDFKWKIVKTEQLVAYFNQKTGRNLTPFFDQYLRQTAPPKLEYQTRPAPNGLLLRYRWNAAEPGFDMPIDVTLDRGKTFRRLQPNSEWQTTTLPRTDDSTASPEPLSVPFRIATERFYAEGVEVK
ncbi:MAG: M1 family metallopeptidase [Sphingobacteriaceae bacterium]|nr:M1 family metallopeptidase [Cytophagaceae bacterium]